MSPADGDTVARRLQKVHPDPAVAHALQAAGFGSAVEIAHHAPADFVRGVAPHLGGDTALAHEAHARATQIDNAVMHAWANVHSAVRDPHFNALKAANLATEAQETFDALPSYQELFGSLDYCSCSECRSIFGPAAYLVDLLRIIDAYVTAPNSGTLASSPFAFDTRRPDIGAIPLTCEQTNTTFPLLDIVNERLGALASGYLGNPPDLFEALSKTPYPFELPFHLPWEQILLYLGQIGVPLLDVYAAFGAAAEDAARARFGISSPQATFVVTSLAASPAALAAAYGVSQDTLAGLADVTAFLTATGLELEDLLSLLIQDLSADELSSGVAAGFFVNLGLGGKWLTYVPGDATKRTAATIGGLASAPDDPLDRIGRFVRLAAQLGWDYPTLDWALRSVGGGTADISTDSIAALGTIADLAARLELDVATACTLAGPLKPYGSGDESQSPFDAAFNDPLVAGSDVYHPPTPLNPAYDSPVRSWTAGSSDPAQQALGARLTAATGLSSGDLTTLAGNLWGASGEVHLTFDALAALYRHALLQRATGMTAAGYFTFMSRLGLTVKGLLAPAPALTDVETLLDRAAWLGTSGVTLDQIDYFLGAPAPPTVNPLFQVDAVPSWLGTVRTATTGLSGPPLDAALIKQLALLFGVAPETAATVAAEAQTAAAPVLPKGVTWEEAFVAAPTSAGGPPPYLGYVTTYLTWFSRWMVLAGALSLPAELLASLTAHPEAYGFAAPLNLTSVYWLSTFQQLVAEYGDTAGRLMAFVDPSVTDPPADPAAELSAATGWDAGQVTSMLVPFATEKNRVLVVQALDRRFGVLKRLGADPAFVTHLVEVTTTGAWADYLKLVDLVSATVRARVPDDQWPAIATQLDGRVQVRQRDALAPFVLVNMRAKHPEIATLRNVSEYLLVDVETSGVPQISRVREALNAAQLYLQRCRLQLEPIAELEIPGAWWEWLGSYRVWEANREVFLYPENYLDPALRKDKTKLFGDLQNQLQQSPVTDESVDAAYRSYLDGLVGLADLDYVDAYRCTVNDVERGPLDTTFLFARTSTDPYKYYSISYDSGVWGSWQPIHVTIPAPVITPVYAFNRLFLFWVELKVAKDAHIQGSQSTDQGASTQGIAYQATIRYSFTDFSEDWIPPQTLVGDEVVYYMPSASDQTGSLGPLSGRPDLFQMDDLFWNKVSVTVVDPVVEDGEPDPSEQIMIVTLGPYLETGTGVGPLTQPTQPPPPLSNPGSSSLAFAERIYAVTTSFNQLVGSPPGVFAYMPVIDSIVLDHQLNPSFVQRPNEVIVFERDLRENAPPLVKPEIENVLGTVALATADCAYIATAMADYTPDVASTRPTLPLTVSSLVGGPIDSATAQVIFDALVAQKVVTGGVVSPAFSSNPDLSFLAPAGVAETDVPWVRAALLEAMGDPTLFSTVPVKTARIVAVNNRPGSFLLAVGDETFLLTPRDVTYADIAQSTDSTALASSPLVFDSYFAPVTASFYTKVFLDLVGAGLVKKLGDYYGLLTPAFNQATDLSFLFTGEPAAQKAVLITQVRRILLALPSLTMLSYQGGAIPRFVTPTSFITVDINATASKQAFADLYANGIIDSQGNLKTEVSATTDLSFVLVGAPDSIRDEIRAILMQLPKFLQTSSFVTPGNVQPGIDPAQSQEAFTALVGAGILDLQGAVTPSFGPSTDLSFLFPEVPEPTRDVLIGEVRAVLQRFFDSTFRIDSNEIGFAVERVSARASARELSYALFAGGIDEALSLASQNAPVVAELPFSRLGPSATAIDPPPLSDGAQIDFDGPYGLYYWELFFHAPLLVASSLASNQQFEAAERWLKFVLDPTAAEQLVQEDSFVTPDIDAATSKAAFAALVTAKVLVPVDGGGARVAPGYTPATPLGPYFQSVPPDVVAQYRAILSNLQLATPASHYWQFRPFRTHTLESLLATLTDATQIAVYENDPFDPDAIARLRIGAYEKATVMAYVDLLLSWGDMLFTQYTWESITSAILLYMYAEDLLGPRPVDLGPCPTPATALTFDEIRTQYGTGHIPQFLIDLEDALPAMPADAGGLNPPGTPFNALDAYFCVPPNDHLASYWDRVADRLDKIRNGENIAGVPTPLALFDPPLDPGALLRAAASGAGFLGVAGGGAAKPTSTYRFRALFEQALQLANQVRDLGGALLTALESGSAAALEALRSTQETALLDLTTAMKQQQIEQLQQTVTGLTASRDKAQFEADYYANLKEQGLSSQELLTRALDAEAIYFQALTIPFHGIAIAGYLSPSIFGLADGGMEWGDAINQGAEIAAGTSQVMALSSALTATTGEFDRRSEDWDFQSQSATRDVAIYQSQIDATNVQLETARQDLLVHEQTIQQSNAISAFLSSRFTNAELFSWMADRIAAVYFDSYTTAVQAARAAELAYQYEQNRTDTFVSYQYWDSLYRGLCAGDNLVHSLGQLSAAYAAADARKLEIEKTISLRQLCPDQLENLRAGKPAGFDITETMLDFDFPGQYARQISSVSVSIPAVVGPYQNINAVLRQESSKVVMAADKAVVDYLISLDSGESPPAPKSGLRSDWLPLQEIAISRGVDDTGMFELSFGGDQYMPFEGTGVVSSWTLAIPPENNRIDLAQLTDVIVKVRYSALDGGSTFDGSPSFRTDVIDILRAHNARFRGSLYVDAAQMFPTAWYAFMNPGPDPATQTMTFPVEQGMFPYLPTMVLDTVTVRIDVGPAVATTDSTDFVTLVIGSSSHPLKFTGGIAQLSDLALGAADFLQPWSLVVTLAHSPDPHLVRNGALDPAELLDFELILAYEADVLPPKKQTSPGGGG